MAKYAAAQTGNYGDTSTWDQVANTPSMHASNDISTALANTVGFTAPNTTNAVTGVLLYLTNKAASGSPTQITVTLQESTVNTAATKTISLANVNLGWIYIRFDTPYVYTTTAANAYRFRIETDTGTVSFAQVQSTANPCYMATDDRHAVPTADNVFIIGHNEQTAVTVTLNGTRTCGTTSVLGASPRTIVPGLIAGNGGGLTADTTASSQLTCTGPHLYDAGGNLTIGTTGSPLDAAYTCEIIQAGTTQAAPFGLLTGSTYSLQGTPKSSTSLWKTEIVSGVGTAASPLVTSDAVDWDVGDEILIAASDDGSTNYQETESRFIITKNSATSYVLSDTSGGSEAAFDYTHGAGTLVVNVQRNIIIRANSSATPQNYVMQAQSSDTGRDIDWVRFQYIDPTLFFGVVPTSFVNIGDNVNIDYCVGYYGPNSMFRFDSNTTAKTHTGLIAYSDAAASAGLNGSACGGFLIGSSQNQTLQDCISMANGTNGFLLTSSFSNELNGCIAVASNISNIAAGAGGIFSSASGQNSFVNCELHANRGNGVRLGTSIGDAFIDCLFGTKGENTTTDVFTVSTTFNDTLFDSCIFGSAARITNYLNQTIGSEIKFNRIDDTDNVHAWYNTTGFGESEDTVIRSPGLSVKLNPENASAGFSWSFQVPATANSIVSFRGFFLKNATLGASVVTIELYLPNNSPSGGSPDDSYILDNTTGATFSDANEQAVNLVANYNGDTPGVATVVVNVKSNDPGAALYADDFFNAGDRSVTFDQVTGLNTWVEGKPISVIQPSVPSADDTAAAVWSYLLANITTTDTTGELLQKLLTKKQFIQLD